jgi:hypothetical protein
LVLLRASRGAPCVLGWLKKRQALGHWGLDSPPRFAWCVLRTSLPEPQQALGHWGLDFPPRFAWCVLRTSLPEPQPALGLAEFVSVLVSFVDRDLLVPRFG